VKLHIDCLLPSFCFSANLILCHHPVL